jgi:hypothetical protein
MTADVAATKISGAWPQVLEGGDQVKLGIDTASEPRKSIVTNRRNKTWYNKSHSEQPTVE